MPDDFNQQIIDEFRANHGRVGGMFARSRLLLLTTTGVRSGKPHTVPLLYLPDGERLVIIGSAGGGPKHPDWYHNIRANPHVTVEDGLFTHEAEAVILDGEEREQIFARAVEADARWAEYAARSGRELPVVALRIVSSTPHATRWGDGLKHVHDAFRRELSLIREEVAGAGPRLGAQLRINCLAVCGGLHVHHEMEDGQMFPSLEAGHPELASVIARLRREHETVARLVDELKDAVSRTEADARDILGEVDRLIEELEAHLRYEEQELVPLLNELSE